MVRSKKLSALAMSLMLGANLLSVAQAQSIKRNADGSVEVSDTGPSGTLDMSTGEHITTHQSRSRRSAGGSASRKARAPVVHVSTKPLTRDSALAKAEALEKAAADALSAAAALRSAAGQKPKAKPVKAAPAAPKPSGKQIMLMPNLARPKVAPAGK